ncbi:S41 family peptidase [Corynebacterium hylobatis]|uniref:S41 family peptidase n=1 Tax=Corynebacterium hylobatis TaxID=1859290 RepID=UPI0013E0C786|nr:S41 family peptidase [Corynebacterium hylobatis]
MVKKMLIGCSGLVLILAVVAVVVLYIWGPTYGAAILGRPIFVLPPTPERYAAVVLDTVQQRGVYAASPEFERARAAAEQAAGQAEDIDEIHDELNAALIAAGGKHSRLLSPEEMSDYLATSAEQPTVTVQDRIAVATVPAHRLEDDSQVYAETLAYGLEEAIGQGACVVVVDLRGNTGGDMGPMLGGLSGLLPDGPAMSFVDRHSEQPVVIEGNSVRGGGSMVGIEGVDKHNLPVAVLVDEMTGSSGEMTMLAFRGLDNARSFGVPTAGYTTGNMVVTMPDQAQMMLTVVQVKDRTGEIFNDTPIDPDEVTDDAMDEARNWLGAQRGCA